MTRDHVERVEAVDPHPAWLAYGHWQVLDLECVEAAGLGDDDGPHRRRCGVTAYCRMAHTVLIQVLAAWKGPAGAPGAGPR